MTTSGFLLDANVLIAAKNSYYGFDLCPGFWEALLAAHTSRSVFSLDRVRDELLRVDDDLVHWVNNLPESFFLSSADQNTIARFGDMQRWAQQNQQFLPSAREQFAKAADCWLMASAKAHGHTVVTLEAFNVDIRKSIKIPNVCQHFSIPYVNTFVMLKALRTSFMLGSSGSPFSRKS